MKKGFTLLELLITISLIGILSMIIFVTIDEIQEKGYESEMESDYSTLKAQSERYYSRYNTFYMNSEYSGSLCTTKKYGFGGVLGPGIFRDIAKDASLPDDKIITQNETKGSWDQATCHATHDAWVVESPLPDSTSSKPSMYCEDSTGLFIKQNINIGAYDYSCL